MLKRINLQLLAEPAAGDPGSGGTPPAATPPAASATTPASVNFTPDQLSAIDKIAVDRAERASKSALSSYFQQQGMTEAQAAEAFKVYKEQKAKELPASAAEAIAAERKRADEAVAASNLSLIKADAKLLAAELGARTDRIDTMLAMAKLGEIKVTDGTVDQAAVKAALEAVIKQFPEWKAEVKTPPKFGAPPGASQTPPGKPMSLSDAIAEHYMK